MRAVSLLILCSLCLAGLTAWAEVIKIDGPRVRLSDLPGHLADSADADLGPAPAPGLRGRIYRQQVIGLVQPGSRLPALWEIETRAQLLSCGDLGQRVSDSLAGILPAGLRVARVACTRPLPIPLGEPRFTASLGPAGARAGRLPVEVRYQVGDWPPQTLTVIAEIEGSIPIAIASSDLTLGATLAPGTVRLEERDARGLPSDAITDLAELSGKKLRTGVRAGTILRRGMLSAVPLIVRGSAVTISVALDGMRITASGVAREDGAAGDMISVLCQTSSRLIRARVVEPRHVVVDL